MRRLLTKADWYIKIMLLLYSYFAYYILAAIGITFGYHRYFSHREFSAPKWLQVIFLYFGLLCGGRSALTWSAVHRMHHAYADTEKDPHSPIYKKWYEIVFSLWRVKKIPRKFCKDLLNDNLVMHFHTEGWKYLFLTYFFAAVYDWKLLICLLLIFVYSYIGFGLLNYLGHNNNGPINNFMINAFAPFEGNHRDHHEKSKKKISA